MQVITEEQVIAQLKTIVDPEIGVDIYEMGMIYEIIISMDNHIFIKMTLTSPNCPVAESMPGDVHAAVLGIPGAEDVKVELTFEPPWDMVMMSPEAKLQLGLL